MKLISYEKQPVFDYCAVVPVLFCFVFLFQSNEIKTLYVCNNSRLSFPKKVKKKKKKKIEELYKCRYTPICIAVEVVTFNSSSASAGRNVNGSASSRGFVRTSKISVSEIRGTKTKERRDRRVFKSTLRNDQLAYRQ